MDLHVKASYSWIMRAILNQRDYIHDNQILQADMNRRQRFQCSEMYKAIHLLSNSSSPLAIFILYLVCHGKLPIKSMLFRFGMVEDKNYIFCDNEETVSHLFFVCEEMKSIWRNVL